MVSIYIIIFALTAMLFSFLDYLAFFRGLSGTSSYVASIGTGLLTAAVLVFIIVMRSTSIENVHVTPMCDDTTLRDDLI